MSSISGLTRPTAASLRSKRFRGAWKQRKTEERDFRYFACEKMGLTRSIYRPVILAPKQKRLLLL